MNVQKQQWARLNGTSIIDATRAGLQNLLEVLIAKGRNVNAQQENSMDTPLHKASRQGRTRLVEILLANQANIRKVNRTGETALHLASLMGHKLVVMALLEAGAEMDNFNWCRETHELVSDDQGVGQSAKYRPMYKV